MTDTGKIQVRTRDELTFSEHESDIDEPVILSVVSSWRRSSEVVLKRCEGVDLAEGLGTAEFPGGGAALPQSAGPDGRGAHGFVPA